MRPRFLFIFAHPDDESFCCGGTVALARRRNLDVTFVCATKGGQGKTGESKLWQGIGLTNVRYREFITAARVLDVRDVHCWGYADRRLSAASEPRVVGRITSFLNRLRPDCLVTFGPDGVSGHADHKAISRFVTAAFKRWHRTTSVSAELLYVLLPRSFYRHYRLPLPRGLRVPDYRVDIHRVLALKAAAIERHRTQRVVRERFAHVHRTVPETLHREYFRHAAGDRIARSLPFIRPERPGKS